MFFPGSFGLLWAVGARLELGMVPLWLVLVLAAATKQQELRARVKHTYQKINLSLGGSGHGEQPQHLKTWKALLKFDCNLCRTNVGNPSAGI